MKRGHSGGGEVRKGSTVGPNYPEENYENPWNVGIDHVYGDGENKTLMSPTQTIEGMGVVELRNDYDSFWEHGTRGIATKGSPEKRRGHTPRGKGEN